jgi:hypothetical protein
MWQIPSHKAIGHAHDPSAESSGDQVHRHTHIFSTRDTGYDVASSAIHMVHILCSTIEARYALRVEYAHRILRCSTACGGFGL